MSRVYICDKCGKTITSSEFVESKGNGEYEIAAASNLNIFDGNRNLDLCFECKLKLYNWLFNGASLDDELSERKARLRADSQIIAVAKADLS